MATEVRPFRGLLYSSRLIHEADNLIAPPYDNISPEQKRDLLSRHVHNVVRLILPVGEDDGQWHAGAARIYNQWLQDKVLIRDDCPSIYLYEQEFSHAGRTHLRRGFIAAKRLEERGESGTIPHERTFDGPKADRLKLMRAIPANLSPIFVLYSDPGNCALSLLDSGDPAKAMEARDTFGACHRLLRVTDPAVHAALAETMRDKPVLIADGHHRYETAMNFRDEMRARNPNASREASWNYQMMFFSPMEDPGLLILPWQRLVTAGPVPADFMHRLNPWFEAESVPSEKKDNALALLKDAGKRGMAFGLYQNRALHLLKGKATIKFEMERLYPNPAEAPLRKLDVNILHRLVIEKGLGLDEKSSIDRIRYIRNPLEAMSRTDAGEFALVLFINPSPVQQIMEVANAGLRMPHKSTDFFPKLLTGLVMNPLV